MNLLLQLLFFGISLQSYYFFSVSMPVFSVASLLLMGLIFWITPQDSMKLPKYPTGYIFLGYLLLLLWSLIGLAFYSDIPDIKRLASFLIMLFGIVIASLLLKKIRLDKLLRFYLSAHVFFFFLQFIVYYVSGYVIDYLQPLTGEEQRVFGGSFTFEHFGNRFMRASGLYSEPGTYATFIAPMLALFYRWHDQSSVNRSIFWMSLSSLVLSMSTYGCVFAMLIVLTAKKIRKSYRIASFGGLVLLILPYLYYRFVWMASIGHDTGLGIRNIYIRESFEFLFSEPLGFIFGSDLLSLQQRVYHGMADNDVGLVFYLLQFTGVPFTIFFFLVCLYTITKVDISARNVLIILLLSKQSLFAPFIVFVLTCALWRRDVRITLMENSSYKSHGTVIANSPYTLGNMSWRI